MTSLTSRLADIIIMCFGTTVPPAGESGRDHLFKGVCIILSPEYYNAWKAAGSPPPITTDPKGQFAGRFISLTVKFQSFDSSGKRIKGKFLKFALTSVYRISPLSRSRSSTVLQRLQRPTRPDTQQYTDPH